jgi:hypothetical protein
MSNWGLPYTHKEGISFSNNNKHSIILKSMEECNNKIKSLILLMLIMVLIWEINRRKAWIRLRMCSLEEELSVNNDSLNLKWFKEILIIY